jgi:predicted HAD superfamily phosphohydrolase YqeG
MDKRTLKVYDVSITNLLHLGAEGIVLDVDDPIFKKEEQLD